MENQTNAPERELLLRRVATGGGSWAVAIVGLTFGACAVAGAIALMAAFALETPVFAPAIFLLILGLLLVGLSIYMLARAISNNRKSKELMEYDPAKNVFVIHPLFGPEIEFAPKDYVAITRNFGSDFIVQVVYYEPSGRPRKKRLGYSFDVPQATPRINEICGRK